LAGIKPRAITDYGTWPGRADQVRSDAACIAGRGPCSTRANCSAGSFPPFGPVSPNTFTPLSVAESCSAPVGSGGSRAPSADDELFPPGGRSGLLASPFSFFLKGSPSDSACLLEKGQLSSARGLDWPESAAPEAAAVAGFGCVSPRFKKGLFRSGGFTGVERNSGFWRQNKSLLPADHRQQESEYHGVRLFRLSRIP